MNVQSLLDQILKSANAGPGRTDLGKYATGAVAGGVLGLLLGGRRRSAVLRYGSAAALGALAWNAYRDWQAQQPQADAGVPAAGAEAQPFAALPAPQADAHSWAMLRAMLAAARADGHVDAAEQAHIDEAVQHLGGDAELRGRVLAETRRPVDPAEIASGVQDPAQAAEVYLASVVVCAEIGTMERAYLDALASALKLPPTLKTDLERRAAAA